LIRLLGVLESLERDECKTLIEKYGGRVTTAISGKTNYLIAGRDVSEGKVSKAEEMNIKTLSEDDLLEMIRTRPGDEGTPKKQPVTIPEPSPVKLKRKSSSTVKKTTDTDIVVIPKSPIDDESSLLCTYLFNR
jgi:replication factor C subunit 1